MASDVSHFISRWCVDIWCFIWVNIDSNTCKLSDKIFACPLGKHITLMSLRGRSCSQTKHCSTYIRKIHLQISRLHRKRYFGSWKSISVQQNSSYRMFHLWRVYCRYIQIHANDQKENTWFQPMRTVSLMPDLTWPRWQSLTEVISDLTSFWGVSILFHSWV